MMQWLLVLLLCTVPVAARADLVCEIPDDVRPATTCSGFFGDSEARQANAELRERRLIDVTAGTYAVDLTYRGDWDTPRGVSFADVELVDTLACDGEMAAIIDLQPRADIGCPAGRYVVLADASIGPDVSVLAILSQILLFVHDGELQYLKVDGAQDPVFRMAWRAPFTIVKPTTRGRSGPVKTTRNKRRSRRH